MGSLQRITDLKPTKPTGASCSNAKLAAEPLRCPVCDQPTQLAGMVFTRDTHEPKECWGCWEKRSKAEQVAREAQSVLGDLPAWVRRELEVAGVAPREMKAELDPAKIPVNVRQNVEIIGKAMPRAIVDVLLDGRIPDKGFGLGAATGGGKTSTLVAVLKRGAETFAKREAPARGTVSYRQDLEFVCWPDEVTWLRGHATDDRSAARIERLSEVPLLVLDDLGRERIKGSYTEDWAASQLDGIINARYRHERPTIWTTNVPEVAEDKRDLLTLYGAALLSRLTADNPLVWIPGLRSLR